jgi:FtsP/CotA-like multicopper oxidase with cupredoxin domain
MRPISRRDALQLGGLGLASTIVGGAGLARMTTAQPRFSPVLDAALTEPSVLPSTDGVLDLRLEAGRRRVRLAGRKATVLSFNGAVPGPTLHLQPGDRLRIELVNRLSTPTNLHTHGLHVSPQGNSDNPFTTVEPGRSFRYDYRLPANHPPGTYWYHPHLHGLAADQVFGGLYGTIIVAEPTPLPITRERVLVISDISLDGDGILQPVTAMARMTGREGDLVLVNGQTRPRLTASPGERQRWRIVNACTARYLRLRLDGQQMHLLGIDSGRYDEPRRVSEVVLAAGNRADLLVTTGQRGSSLRALPYDRGAMAGMGMGGNGMGGGNGPTSSSSGREFTLATLNVAGIPAASPEPLPPPPAARDLRGSTVAARRQLTLAMSMSMGAAGMRSTIDGNTFDPNRVDMTARIGTVEEWTVTNTSPMDHPLHLHTWPMQIVAQGGQPVGPPTWQDVVNIPARSTTTIRVSFDAFAGRTVYHCHILDHEDNGMMGIVEAE